MKLANLLLFLFISSYAFSQPGLIKKGSMDAGGQVKILELPGKRYLVNGEQSFNGNVTPFIQVVDSDFRNLWSRVFTGQYGGIGEKAILLSDGSIVYCGSSGSPDGDFTAPGKADGNAWAARFSSSGTLLWIKIFGGNGGDAFLDVVQQNNGDLLFLGTTDSRDGDLAGRPAGRQFDIWLLSTDINGNIKGQKFLGGSGEESVGGMVKLNSGYSLAVITSSNDGDLAGIKPEARPDLWLIKLNESLNITSQKLFNSKGYENLTFNGIAVGPNSNISVVYSEGWASLPKFLIANFDSSLNKKWEKTVGSKGTSFAGIYSGDPAGILLTGTVGYVDEPDNAYAIDTRLAQQQSNAAAGIFEILDPLDGSIKWRMNLGDNFTYFTNAILNSAGNLVISSMQECCKYDGYDPRGGPTLYEIRQPSVFKGKLFLDINANNQFDPGTDTEDIRRAGLLGRISVSTSSALLDYTLANRAVLDQFYIPVDDNEYISELSFDDYRDAERFSIQPSSNTFKFNGFNQKDSAYFGIVPTVLESDLSIQFIPLTNGAAGLKGRYKILIENTGVQNFDSVNIKLSKHPTFKYLTATKAPLQVTADTISWMVRNMPFLSKDSIIVEFMLPKPPELTYGAYTIFNASLASFPEDLDPSNNSQTVERELLRQSLAVRGVDMKVTPRTSPVPGKSTDFDIEFTYTGELDTLYAGLKILLSKMKILGADPAISAVKNDTLILNDFTMINGQTRKMKLTCQVFQVPDVKYGENIRILAYIDARLLDYSLTDITPGKYEFTLDPFYFQDEPSRPEETNNIAWLRSMETGSFNTLGKNTLVEGSGDGNFIAVTTVDQNTNRYLLLQKIDREGVILWEKLIKDSTLHDVRAFNIQTDGSLVLLTQKQSPLLVPTSVWAAVTTFDASGNIKWTTDLEKETATGTNRTYAIAGGLTLLPDQQVIVSGYRYFPELKSDTSYESGWVSKLDITGKITRSNRVKYTATHTRFTTHGPVFNDQILMAGTDEFGFDSPVGGFRKTASNAVFSVNTNDLTTTLVAKPLELQYRDGITGINRLGHLNILYGTSEYNEQTGHQVRIPISQIQALNDRMELIWKKDLYLSTNTGTGVIKKDNKGLVGTLTLADRFTNAIIPGYMRFDSAGNIIALRVLKPERINGSTSSFPDVAVLGTDDYVFAGNTVAKSINGTVVTTNKNLVNLVKVSKNNRIKGSVFADLNNNGSRDPQEVGVNDVNITVVTDSATRNIKTDSLGTFLIASGKGKLKARVLNTNSFYRAAPDSLELNLQEYMQSDSITFRLIPVKDSSDLQVSLLPLNIARPGFEAEYQVVVSNAGTKPLNNCVVKLGKDRRQALLQSSRPFSSFVGDTITWNISVIQPQTELRWTVNMRNNAPPALTNTDSLLLVLTGSPMAGDGNTVNNTAQLVQPVKGSYDPNDKTEVNNGTFTPEQLSRRENLTYLVRFQNTGNDTAFRVVILDTIDSKLDPSTIEVISASHSFQWELLKGNICRWTFNNILLPDSSTNEKLSHGYVAFTIKPKETLKIGESVRNTASIYFDFNLPIVTNTVVTTVQARLVTSVSTVNNPVININAYPNPTTGSLNLNMKGNIRGNLKVMVYDMSGKLVLQENKGQQFTQGIDMKLDLSKQKPGIYYIDVILGQDHVPFRILKTN